MERLAGLKSDDHCCKEAHLALQTIVEQIQVSMNGLSWESAALSAIEAALQESQLTPATARSRAAGHDSVDLYGDVLAEYDNDLGRAKVWLTEVWKPADVLGDTPVWAPRIPPLLLSVSDSEREKGHHVPAQTKSLEEAAPPAAQRGPVAD